MIDTHCHLDMEQFALDREAVIARARDAGFEALITIGADIEEARVAVDLAEKHSIIYATVGIHPHDAKDFGEESNRAMKAWTCHPKVVAIGEIGLDYHYDLSPREVQREVFKFQLDFARDAGMPVVIHSREANEDTMRILEESGVKKGVLHCFSGDREMAEWALGRGFFISIAGPVTFKTSSRLQDIARRIPDDFLLIETDAPYLAPVPHRGKRNEPAFLIETARFIAGLRAVSLEDIDRITTTNAKRLFGIGRLPKGEVAYQIRESLYLNITNRCTSCCTFCVRFHTDYVKGHNLRLQREPSLEELKEAVSDPRRFKEIVFCGYGEPLLRLEVVKDLANWVKARGGRVRINTNGHGNLINERNILPELQGIVDIVSVSLNAPDAETYERICKPTFSGAFDAVLEFMREAKKYIPEVQATVVSLKGVDIAHCRKITEEMGVSLRVRHLDVVG